MEHSVSSRAGERSRPALLVSAVLALLVALTALLAPGIATPASAADATANRVKPTLSGTARVGQTLTLDKGVWSPADATLTVQWMSQDGTATPVAIASATGDTYVLAAADQGKSVFARVTGSATLTADTAKVVPVAKCGPIEALCDVGKPAAKSSPTKTADPTITGTPQVGVELTAGNDAWSEASTRQYQWYADDVAIDRAGANAAKFTPTTAEVGKKLKVKVWATATASGLTGIPATTAETAAVAPDPNQPRQNTALPTITNTKPAVGDTLLANPGTWNPSDGTTEYSYQWLVDGAPTAASAGLFPFQLKVTDAMLGKRISVRVTALASAGVSEASATSAQTEAVRAATGTPGTKAEPAMTVNVKVKKSGKVVVKAKVTATGVPVVTGQAKVKVTRGGGKAVTVDLVNGKVKLSWAKLRKGKHKAKVTYLGNDQLAPTSTVVVPFTKR